MLNAYWAAVDWKAVAAAAGGIGAVASPFCIAWLNGRTTRSQAQAKAAETAQDRIDRISREQYEAMRAERDHAQTRARELEQRCDELERDRDDGWDRGRGMEEWAHSQRHQFCRLGQAFNGLLAQFARLARGDLPPDRITKLLAELTEVEEPPRVPPLRDIDRKSP